MTAIRTGGDHAAVSGRAAAALHGLETFRPGTVEVTVRRGGRIRGIDVVQHQTTRFDEQDIIEIDGIRCTSLERTIIDLASVITAYRLERVIDEYERRAGTLDRLVDRATNLHRPGQPGTKRVLADIAKRQTRGMVRGSWFEKLVQECVTSPAIPPVETQYELRSATGAFIGRFDLAIPSVRLLIEAHSRRFHTGEHLELIDQRRDNLAGLEGWDVRYVGWADTSTPRRVRRFIERLVERRAKDLGLAAGPTDRSEVGTPPAGPPGEFPTSA